MSTDAYPPYRWTAGGDEVAEGRAHYRVGVKVGDMRRAVRAEFEGRWGWWWRWLERIGFIREVR